jgi:hypothetical protein
LQFARVWRQAKAPASFAEPMMPSPSASQSIHLEHAESKHETRWLPAGAFRRLHFRVNFSPESSLWTSVKFLQKNQRKPAPNWRNKKDLAQN